MEYTIDISQSPYGSDSVMFEKDYITLKDGLSVIIGCNGSGKSTLLRMIKEHCIIHNIPMLYYNNINDGGYHSRDNRLTFSDMKYTNGSLQSSEGESIIIALNSIIDKVIKIINNLKSGDEPYKGVRGNIEYISNIFKYETDDTKWETDKLFLLFDSVDSGLSLDTIYDVKKYMIDPVINRCKNSNINLYLIITSNKFELTHNTKCILANKLEYININSYQQFKNVIVESRIMKDMREGVDKREQRY